MSRFLMAGWPFHGHVFPQIAIARALREQGHEVAFYTGPQFREVIENEGFTLFPFDRVGEPWKPVHDLEQKLPSRRGSARAGAEAFRNWLVESVPSQVADLEPILDGWQPDVVVSEPALLGPVVILHEKRSLPVALLATFMGPLIGGPDAPPAFGFGMAPGHGVRGRTLHWVADRATDLLARGFRARVDELRAQHGLGPLGCSVNEYTARLPLYLVANVPELDYGRRDLPDSVHYVGRCTWQAPTDTDGAAWLETIPTQRPWVHATEGTSNNGAPFLLRMACEALSDLEVEAVLTTGQRPPESVALGALPPNVHVTRFLRHDELLPRCRVMITNGGARAVLAGMAAGVPLAVVPITWDQPDNARRVTEVGAGVKVNPHSITAAKLRTAVQTLLEDPSYAANARRMAERLAAAGGPQRAADLLSTLAGSARAGTVPTGPRARTVTPERTPS
jgi:MGT family glycosyltransferase